MKKVFNLICYISLGVMILLIVNSFAGDLVFRMTYMTPKITAMSGTVLNPKEFPTQINRKMSRNI